MPRTTRSMAQDELAALAQDSRLSMLHQNQGFHQVFQEQSSCV